MSEHTKNDKINIKVGIVRPISIKEPYKQGHWDYIQRAIEESLVPDTEYTFDVALVSENTKSDVIQNTIIKNLYYSDVIICDLSSLNPNVFFELGIRMAYRKPCVLLLDDRTSAPFDVAPIRYIQYPSSFHRYELEEKQKELRKAVIEVHKTYRDSQKVAYAPFFTEVNVTEVADIDRQERSVLEDIQIKLDYLMKNSSEANISTDGEHFRKFLNDNINMFVQHAKSKGFSRKEFKEKGQSYLKFHSERNGYQKLPKYIFDPIYSEATQKLLSFDVQFSDDFDDDIPF